MRDDWEIKCLGEIGDIFSGNSINAKTKEEKYLNVTTGLNYIATKDIAYNTSINYDNGVKIPYDQTCNFRVAKKGSVLICSEGGSAGRKIGLLNQDVCFVNKLYAISTNEYVIPSYIFYYYQSIGFKLQFKERLTGLIGGVSKNKFKQIEIPIPSTEEQKEIVEILDQTFESIKKAKANIEKNIENAKELFQSKLNKMFSQTGDDWKQINIENLCNKTKNINWKENTESQFDYIDLSSVSRTSLIVTETKKIDSKNAPSRAKKIVNENDIIFGTTRPTLKRATKITKKYNNQICSTGYVVLSPKDPKDSEWIFYFLLSNKFMKRMESLQRGASYPAVSDNDVKKSILSIPSKESIKTQMIENLDALDNHIQSVLLAYEEELENLEDLKKSILQKAFSGELTNKNKAA